MSRMEESGQRLENIYQTLLVLASGKLVLQKRFVQYLTFDQTSQFYWWTQQHIFLSLVTKSFIYLFLFFSFLFESFRWNFSHKEFLMSSDFLFFSFVSIFEAIFLIGIQRIRDYFYLLFLFLFIIFIFIFITFLLKLIDFRFRRWTRCQDSERIELDFDGDQKIDFWIMFWYCYITSQRSVILICCQYCTHQKLRSNFMT